MFVVATVLAVLLAVVFTGAGLSKITRQKQMVEAADHLGFTIQQYQLIGAAEVAGAVGLVIGLWWAPLGVAAAIGLLITMIGAVYFHLTHRDPVSLFGPSAVLGVLALLEIVFRLVSA
jgi:uncharacterized membrane protein YphA (DoxX/SURF4 family)